MEDLTVLSAAANETILESISDGVFTVDHNWRITSFNRAAEEITGTKKNEAIGHYCWEVFRSNMCEGDCALKRTMKEGKSYVSSDTYIINNRKEKVPIGVSTSLLKNEKGDILGGVETFRDYSLVEELRKEIRESARLGDMISHSPLMKKIFKILPQVAESDTTVLIEGETGTGKEVLASTLHNLSNNKNKSFISVNCGALPDTLLESELFGYKKGAFTGADRDKIGLFEAAENGTLLLDEIGETSPAFQVRLLRVLEEKKYQPLGSVEKRPCNARILAATNRDLEKMVLEGHFRRDLYYRINVIKFQLPSLRKRQEDIPHLVEFFIQKLNKLRERAVTGVENQVMKILLDHNYPGNIRELENILEHCFVLCQSNRIALDHLPAYLFATETLQQPQSESIKQTVHNTEKQSILDALKKHNYSRLAAADELGIHKSTLFRKIRKLQIKLPELDGRSTRNIPHQ